VLALLLVGGHGVHVGDVTVQLAGFVFLETLNRITRHGNT